MPVGYLDRHELRGYIVNGMDGCVVRHVKPTGAWRFDALPRDGKPPSAFLFLLRFESLFGYSSSLLFFEFSERNKLTSCSRSLGVLAGQLLGLAEMPAGGTASGDQHRSRTQE